MSNYNLLPEKRIVAKNASSFKYSAILSHRVTKVCLRWSGFYHERIEVAPGVFAVVGQGAVHVHVEPVGALLEPVDVP